MMIGRYSQKAASQTIAHSVPRIAIIHFHATVFGKEETIAGENAAAVCLVLICSVLIGAFEEAAARLNACFRFVVDPFTFLCKTGCLQQHGSQDKNCWG